MTQRLMSILWPAFLVAGAMDGVFFSAFDPLEMHWFGHPVDVSRLGVYTICFFFFWGMGAVCGAASLLLAHSKGEAPGR